MTVKYTRGIIVNDLTCISSPLDTNQLPDGEKYCTCKTPDDKRHNWRNCNSKGTVIAGCNPAHILYPDDGQAILQCKYCCASFVKITPKLLAMLQREEEDSKYDPIHKWKRID